MTFKLFLIAAALGLAGAAGASGNWPEPYPVAATLAPEPMPSVPVRHANSLCDVPPPQHHHSRRQRWRQQCREALTDPGIQAD